MKNIKRRESGEKRRGKEMKQMKEMRSDGEETCGELLSRRQRRYEGEGRHTDRLIWMVGWVEGQ